MVIAGILIPFVGTSLGAAAVFLMKKELSEAVQKCLMGFAAGVMVAASVWSLLLPAIELSGSPQWLPAAAGFAGGIAFLMGCEALSERIEKRRKQNRSQNAMLIFAVTLHNIPEGMAVGVSFAGALKAGSGAAFAAAFALALGIAIQNFPEGAIISMPLAAEGYSKPKAFLYGVLSGVVEPLAAALTLLLTALAVKVLPLLLAFAAGAMVYVCVNELIPYSRSEKSINIGVIGFGVGFLVMMVLDVMFS